MLNRGKINRLLSEKGWSKYKLAKTANIPQSSLHDILSGKIKSPTGERLKSIADALGVSIDDLMESDNEPPKFQPIKLKKPEIDLDTIPEEFTDPDVARAYIGKHEIFSSEGFDLDLMSDEEVLSFGNALLEQMRLVGYKFKK